MSTSRPEICDHPVIQTDNLRFNISDCFRDGSLDLYSAFLLAHEALRIDRKGYLQPAWNHRLSISGLLRLYMHCVTAQAFQLDTMATIAEEWLTHDIPLLEERRPHFLVERLSDGSALTTNQAFLQMLSDMRDQYDSLPDDDGPYHVEVFPWDFAAPERELLVSKTQAQFSNTNIVDPEVENLIVELCSGQWA